MLCMCLELMRFLNEKYCNNKLIPDMLIHTAGQILGVHILEYTSCYVRMETPQQPVQQHIYINKYFRMCGLFKIIPVGFCVMSD